MSDELDPDFAAELRRDFPGPQGRCFVCGTSSDDGRLLELKAGGLLCGPCWESFGITVENQSVN